MFVVVVVVVVVVISIERDDYWHLCQEHDICISVLSLNIAICFQKEGCRIFLVEVDCCLIFFRPLSMIVDCLMLLLSSPSKEAIKDAHSKIMTFALSHDVFACLKKVQ